MAGMEAITSIDIDRLDEEWIRQPKRFYRFALKLADAKNTFTELKAELEVVKAEVDKHIRRFPQSYGITKITDKVVEKEVLVHKKTKRATAALNQAKHQVDILQAVVDTLEMKKKGLENLVTLHGQNYFASPRERGDSEAFHNRLSRAKRKRVKVS